MIQYDIGGKFSLFRVTTFIKADSIVAIANVTALGDNVRNIFSTATSALSEPGSVTITGGTVTDVLTAPYYQNQSGVWRKYVQTQPVRALSPYQDNKSS